MFCSTSTHTLVSTARFERNPTRVGKYRLVRNVLRKSASEKVPKKRTHERRNTSGTVLIVARESTSSHASPTAIQPRSTHVERSVQPAWMAMRFRCVTQSSGSERIQSARLKTYDDALPVGDVSLITSNGNLSTESVDLSPAACNRTLPSPTTDEIDGQFDDRLLPDVVI